MQILIGSKILTRLKKRKGVKILTLDDFDLTGKTVFLRVDMNCPIDPETMEISGTKRIEESTVDYVVIILDRVMKNLRVEPIFGT